MPLDVTSLQDLATEAVGAVTERLTAGAITPAQWLREMERIVTRAHTAAYVAATAERLGVPLAAVKGLSRVERRELEALVAAQRPYLAGFLRDIRAGGLSDAEIRARAALYAGPVRATYSKTRWVGLPAHPGDGSTECLAWCKCSWVERSGEMYWELGAAEHCPTCERRATDWAPWRG